MSSGEKDSQSLDCSSSKLGIFSNYSSNSSDSILCKFYRSFSMSSQLRIRHTLRLSRSLAWDVSLSSVFTIAWSRFKTILLSMFTFFTLISNNLSMLSWACGIKFSLKNFHKCSSSIWKKSIALAISSLMFSFYCFSISMNAQWAFISPSFSMKSCFTCQSFYCEFKSLFSSSSFLIKYHSHSSLIHATYFLSHSSSSFKNEIWFLHSLSIKLIMQHSRSRHSFNICLSRLIAEFEL